VALISGMNIDANGVLETKLQLMLEYLTGGLGSLPVSFKTSSQKRFLWFKNFFKKNI